MCRNRELAERRSDDLSASGSTTRLDVLARQQRVELMVRKRL
jgi:hypothetical protein